jgi:hypothetical protein
MEWSRGSIPQPGMDDNQGPQTAAICCATCALYDILLDILVLFLFLFSHDNQIVPVSTGIVFILILLQALLVLGRHRHIVTIFYVDRTKLCKSYDVKLHKITTKLYINNYLN